MPDAERYAYTASGRLFGEVKLSPILPVTLRHQGHSVNASGLLDTGAAVNVLPYHTGVELGAVWEQQTVRLRLTGNLASDEARVLVLLVETGSFAPVRQVFAWTRAENAPLILGQVNFFMEFDVCFFRSQQAFEARPRTQ